MVAAALAWATGASGSTWIEDPLGTGADAGKTLATAQVTSGAGSLTAISGVLDPGDDPLDAVDLFKIVAAGTEITATSDVGNTDTFQIFLFDASGKGVKGGFTFPGDQLDFTVLTQGATYYLAITLTGWFPYDSSDSPLFDESFFDLNSAAGALEYWSSNPGVTQDPPFTLELLGVEPATQAVPEPATLLFLGSGLLGLGGAAWRRRRR
ncbi:MAG: PEP-CTERM sorting domain-containing protein [Acidobacteria bacterium]|nr:PEP-CTERM sorting domain-containing protein [Acidobacteriota bacterium]